MRKLIIRIFIELYHWQNDEWGESNLPVLTSLLILSALQFFNVISILMIFENITLINLSGFFSSNLALGMIIPFTILIVDYINVSPIKMTIEQNPPQKKRISWIYVLLTLALLIACIVWMVYINEHRK